MNIRSGLHLVGKSTIGRIILVLLAVSMVGLASATVYVYYYVNPTSTVKTQDITLAAGSDSTPPCTTFPCASVAISSTSDTAAVQISMFKANSTFTPPPASYYSNLIQVKDANNAHKILSVQIFGITDTRAADFGQIAVYYCTTQTEFSPSGAPVTPANCVGSPGGLAITSTTGGTLPGFGTGVGIAAGATHYIEVVAYAGSGATVVAGDTIKFNVAVQWI